MKRYEIILVFRHSLSIHQVDETLKTMHSMLVSDGGDIGLCVNVGLKNLAYKIQKHKSGYYIQINLMAVSDVMKKFHEYVRYMEEIVRISIISVDEFSPPYLVKGYDKAKAV